MGCQKILGIQHNQFLALMNTHTQKVRIVRNYNSRMSELWPSQLLNYIYHHHFITARKFFFQKLLFWAVSLILLTLGKKNFLEGIVLSCVYDFVLFFLFVTTITLERLNQSKPNIYTTFDWNSSAKFENGHHRSHGSSKMGITGHMV